MAAVATDIVGRIAELSDSAFAAFCEDIAGMFGVDMLCDRRQVQTMPVRNLREHFKKLTAVHLTKAEGAVNGTFPLIFDQGGLFVLSGVIVMLPESRILEEAKRGSMEDANAMEDAAREVGNLLVGSWDRIFREECPGHGHFTKTSTFIGKPWDKPEQIELQANAEAVVVLYEMTIESYPSFTCAAVFPQAVLGGFAKSEPAAEPVQVDASAPAAPTPPAVPQSPSAAVASEPPSVGAANGPELPEKPAPQSVAQGSSPTAVKEAASSGQPEAEVQPSASPAPVHKDGVILPGRGSPAFDGSKLPSELASAGAGGAPRGSDFAFLDPAYVRSRPQAPLAEILNLTAAEIMDKEVIWASPDDTVQDVIARMQQHNVGYVLIGVDGALEGLVSGSNVLAAVSLYLRPMFAKWHRPQDDATLGVKVKWIMSRPVRTVRPDATLAAMIESMRRCGGRCLPVVDARGGVQGIVTVFDLLLRTLESDQSVSWKGRPPQTPALLI